MANGDGTSRRDPEHTHRPVRAEGESVRSALLRDADRISAIVEVLREMERDLDRASAWLALLLAPDMKRTGDVATDREGGG